MKRMLLAVLMAGLLLGACGDDGGALDGPGAASDDGTSSEDLDASERAAAARVATSMQSDPENLEVTADEADCVGARVVKDLGLERVEAIEWESTDILMAEEDASDVAAAVVACVDVRPVLVKGFTEDGEITTEQAECLSQDLSDDEVTTLLAGGLAHGDDYTGSPEIFGPLADAMLQCMDFGALFAESFAEDGDLSAESAQCMAGAISQDLLRDLLIAGMTEGDTSATEAALAREVMTAAPNCLTDEELAGLGG